MAMFTSTMVAAVLSQPSPSIRTQSGSMAVNIAAGRTFSISCPTDGACNGQVACAGPDVEIVDGACVPTTQFASADTVSSLAAQLSALTESLASTQLAASAQSVAAAAQSTTVAGQISTMASTTAASASQTPCIPYVEFTNSAGACVALNRTCDVYTDDEYFEHIRPTRTSDRVCAPKTVCNDRQWERSPGNTLTNRACRPITNCTAVGQFMETPATRTSDATCVSLPGLNRDSAIASCNVLTEMQNAPSGFYWITTGGRVAQLYCDMETEGGGWTMVGRGKGAAWSCWHTNGDCNVGNSGPAYNQFSGPTWKWSNDRINSIQYTRIRFSGHNVVRGNQYWRGKDASGGGCRYSHMSMATGHCNCASLHADMRSRRCGRNHGGHMGLGDWPNPNGGLHTSHSGNFWYFKKNANHNNHMSSNGYCHGRNGRCDVALWVR